MMLFTVTGIAMCYPAALMGTSNVRIYSCYAMSGIGVSLMVGRYASFTITINK